MSHGGSEYMPASRIALSVGTRHRGRNAAYRGVYEENGAISSFTSPTGIWQRILKANILSARFRQKWGVGTCRFLILTGVLLCPDP